MFFELLLKDVEPRVKSSGFPENEEMITAHLLILSIQFTSDSCQYFFAIYSLDI